MIQYGHGTHVGRRRLHNEDTYLADARLGLWLVADGMGGHAHGEIASAMARDAIKAAVESGQSLDIAIRAAADRITRQGQRISLEGLPMGTTVAAIRADDNGFEAAWVGDSRIYLWDDHLTQISQDHSYVQHLVQQGALTPGEARRHPQRNVVTQALGVTDMEFLDITTVRDTWASSAQLLLCSDGLTEEVDDNEISALLSRGFAPQETADHLIHAALRAGGSDNITVIVLKRC
jgi:protein phosphatase